MTSRSFLHRRRGELLVACAVGAAGVLLYAAGVLSGIDRLGLDLHFRHAGRLPADPRILMIDIDDSTLREPPGWPWPRKRLADLVRLLHEWEADVVLLDLVFSDPVAPRSEHAGLGRHYDLDADLTEKGDRSFDPVIYDDDELADALRTAGNVFLPMFSRLHPPRAIQQVTAAHPDADRRAGACTCQDNRACTCQEGRAAKGRTGACTCQDNRACTCQSLFRHVDPSACAEGTTCPARLVQWLIEDFDAPEDELRQRLANAGPSDADQWHQMLMDARRRAARHAAKQFLAQQADADWPAFRTRMLPRVPPDTLSAEHEMLLTAFREARAAAWLRQNSPAPDPSLTGRLPVVFDATLPLDKLVPAAVGIGMATFDRDQSDGVLRSLHPAVTFDDRMLLQVGLLMACRVRGWDPATLRRDGDALTIGEAGDSLRLPLLPDGTMLLNWHRPPRGTDWRDSFDHLPASRLVEWLTLREAREQNDARLDLAWGELLRVRHAETPAGFHDYADLVRREQSLLSNRDAVMDDDQHRQQEDALTSTRERIQAMRDEARQWLQWVWSQWRDQQPENDAERAERRTFQRLAEQFADDQLPTRISRANDLLESRMAELTATLRPRLTGRICFVGYTASALADFVTTPLYNSMPGVMAHANVVNMVLQGAVPGRAPEYVNMLLLAGGALLIILATASINPTAGGLVLLIVAALTAGLGHRSFATTSLYVSTFPIMTVWLFVWVAMTAYRQLIEERSRRVLQRALGQYTSPAVAARLIERITPADFAPRAIHVTCFFSDLQDFTAISARLGPERTRALLNPYLGALTHVLNEQGALVNKFVGDGVFAFFNAPIRPCADHAPAACRAAQAAVQALAELNRSAAAVHAGDSQVHLTMRIGLSTGEVFVGDYGSERKLDYTCIGDTVNLGSRLERLNKSLGTGILVNDDTRREAGNEFAFRYLGRMRISGFDLPKDVYELLTPAPRSDDQAVFLATFDQAVRLFQTGQWKECLTLLAELRQQHPDDRVIALMESVILRHHERPPDNWDGTLSTDSFITPSQVTNL